jgi:hypothetical protein
LEGENLRTYIFTRREENLLKAFLEGKATRMEIRDIKRRIKIHGKRIRQQVLLMEKFMEKVEAR